MKKQKHYYLLVPKNRAKKPTIFSVQAHFYTYKGIKYYIAKTENNKYWKAFDFETKIMFCQGSTLENTRRIAKGLINLYGEERYKTQVSYVKKSFKKEYGIDIKEYIKLNKVIK